VLFREVADAAIERERGDPGEAPPQLILDKFIEKVELGLLFVAVVASLIPDWLETPWYIFFAHQKKQEPAKEEKKSEDSVVGLGSLFG